MPCPVMHTLAHTEVKVRKLLSYHVLCSAMPQSAVRHSIAQHTLCFETPVTHQHALLHRTVANHDCLLKPALAAYPAQLEVSSI